MEGIERWEAGRRGIEIYVAATLETTLLSALYIGGAMVEEH